VGDSCNSWRIEKRDTATGARLTPSLPTACSIETAGGPVVVAGGRKLTGGDASSRAEIRSVSKGERLFSF